MTNQDISRYDLSMGAKKFSSVMDEKVWKELKALSEEMNVDISSLLSEAVVDLVQKKKIRPGFHKLADEAMNEFDEALSELAK